MERFGELHSNKRAASRATVLGHEFSLPKALIDTGVR